MGPFFAFFLSFFLLLIKLEFVFFSYCLVVGSSLVVLVSVKVLNEVLLELTGVKDSNLTSFRLFFSFRCCSGGQVVSIAIGSCSRSSFVAVLKSYCFIFPSFAFSTSSSLRLLVVK